MNKRDKDPFDELFEEVFRNFFSGGPRRSGLDDLFSEIESMFGNIDEENFWDSIDRKRKLSNEGPYRFGFSIRMGPDDQPDIKTFGDRSKEEGREPLVDVFGDDESVLVTAEMPGVEKDDIEFSIKGKELKIKAEGRAEKYSKTIELPKKVEDEPEEVNYLNGVLSLKLKTKNS